MRRIISVALVVTAGLLVLLALAGAVAAKKQKKHHHAATPAAIKTGTYKAKVGTLAFNITLAKASCASAPAGAKAAHLCVSLPVSPEIECHGAVGTTGTLGSYSTPVALSSTGTATEKQAVTGAASTPGGPPSPGTSAFAVSFTKTGTATGYLELNLTITFGDAILPCASGRVPFTAKLG